MNVSRLWQPHGKAILYVASGFLGMVVCSLLWWNIPWLTPQAPLSPALRQEYQSLLALREESREELAYKLQKLESFQQKHLPEHWQNIWQTRQRLSDRQCQLDDWEGYQQLEKKIGGEKNPFRVCLELRLALVRFRHREYAARIEQRIRQNEIKMRQWLEAHMVEIGLLLQEKRLGEITARSTPQLLKALAAAWEPLIPNAEQRQMWSALIAAYEQIPGEGGDPATNNNQSLDQLLLQYHQNQFSRYANKFHHWMRLREYDLAQKGLENIWESLHSMENVAADENLIREVRDKLKAVQAVKTLLSIANEGAKSAVGTLHTFVLRNGTTFVGRILHYAFGHFETQIGNEKKIQIPLNELRGEDIVEFALQHKSNKYVYEYAGIFYSYEGKWELAQQAFKRAIEEGADVREISGYLRKMPEEAK